MSILSLPKGVWYEADKRRYRVRRYHNKVVYGPYYYRTLEAAMTKHESLDDFLQTIPKTRRPRHKPQAEGE